MQLSGVGGGSEDREPREGVACAWSSAGDGLCKVFPVYVCLEDALWLFDLRGVSRGLEPVSGLGLLDVPEQQLPTGQLFLRDTQKMIYIVVIVISILIVIVKFIMERKMGEQLMEVKTSIIESFLKEYIYDGNGEFMDNVREI